jgi:hypothetical protein
MKFRSSKIIFAALALGFVGSASAIGQQGDSRVQVNGSFTLADEGDDTIISTLQYQSYVTDSLTIGGLFTLTDTGGDSTTIFGVTIKKGFPSASDVVPYVGAAALLLTADALPDDEFIYSISGGADVYVEENFGFNFDATQGLTDDFYEDLILSVGAFYEF